MRLAAAAAALLALAGCALTDGSAEVDSLGQKLALRWGVSPESVPRLVDELSRHLDVRAYLECMVAEREKPRPDMRRCRRWLDLDLEDSGSGKGTPAGADAPASWRDLARESIKRHEGLRLEPYELLGTLHVCYGQVVADPDSLPAEIDVRYCEALLDSYLPTAISDAQWFAGTAWRAAGRHRRAALVDLAYAMGRTRMARLGMMKVAVGSLEWGIAAGELLRSEWALTRSARAADLAAWLRRDD